MKSFISENPYQDQSSGGRGTVINLEMQSLLSSDRKGDGGKTLVALDFPSNLPKDSELESRACSSRISWQATRGWVWCKDVYTHQGWASWSGAATKGASVKFGMDPDGLCIHMRLRSGRVYVVLSENGSPLGKHEGIVLEPNARL
jgi:hypothetical protein